MNSIPPETQSLPCLSCGYDLRGLRDDPERCPECGTNNAGHAERVMQSRAQARFDASHRPKAIALVLFILAAIGLNLFPNASFIALTTLILGGSIFFHTCAALAIVNLLAPPVHKQLERDAWMVCMPWFFVPWLGLISVVLFIYLVVLLVPLLSIMTAIAWLVSYTRLRKRLATESPLRLHVILGGLGILTCFAPVILVVIEIMLIF